MSRPPARRRIPFLAGVISSVSIALSSPGVTAQSPLTFEAALTMDFAANVRGGAEEAAGWLGNLDLTATLDGGAVGWTGGEAFVYVLGNWGDAPSEWVGDYQVTNNIEAPNALRLFEAWASQELADGRISLLAGLRDLNAEFYVMEHGELFLNSSKGVGVALAQTGPNGPSIFPNSALAVRVEGQPSGNLRLRGAVFDAVANDPHDPSRTSIGFSGDEGALLIGEFDLGPGADAWRAMVGGWRYTQTAGGLRDHGLYGVVEGRLGRVGDGELHGFGQYGAAPSDLYPVHAGWGGGLVLSGLRGRPDDRVGLGLVGIEGDDPGLEDRTWELTYEWVARDRVQIRFDAQWVEFPGARDDALVLTTRFTVTP